MTSSNLAAINVPEDHRRDFARDVQSGLSHSPKRLPSKYFYDARGSELFEEICAQPEYYLTRTEIEILRTNGPDMAEAIGANPLVVEYGSGSGIKTEILLQALHDPVAYVPIEISDAALGASVAVLGEKFPHIQMMPLCADFNAVVSLPRPQREPRRRLIFFPGSTIGNLELSAAVRLLGVMRAQMGSSGLALVGIDLRKDPAKLEAAYNDAAGVTRDFTLNLLTRMNRELGMDFDLEAFAHRARYNPLPGRIETHIESLKDQVVHGRGSERYAFGKGERMLVEYSCKYSLAEFSRMAERAELRVLRAWTDPGEQFALQLLGP